MKQGDKVAIVCCSNGQAPSSREKIGRLGNTLREIGLVPVFGDYIYARQSVLSGSAAERAESLMDFYRDREIRAIFDISGGDIANELLPYLDFQEIKESGKLFWGYSDLTTVINAIYTKAGQPSVLYQVRNLIGKNAGKQMEDFAGTVLNGKDDLLRFSHRFLQGDRMQGIVVGGNIRCLLKLAGTEYWPDMSGKILLLEAMGGGVPQMVAYLNQLKQIGVFERAAGILLGTFLKMEEESSVLPIAELVKEYAGRKIPIAQTGELGHRDDSKGILIGKELYLA